MPTNPSISQLRAAVSPQLRPWIWALNSLMLLFGSAYLEGMALMTINAGCVGCWMCLLSWANVPLRSVGPNRQGMCLEACTCMTVLSWVSFSNIVSLNHVKPTVSAGQNQKTQDSRQFWAAERGEWGESVCVSTPCLFSAHFLMCLQRTLLFA